MEVETQGVDPLIRFPAYVPLRKGKAKVPEDVDESKSSLQTPLLPDDIVFEGANLERVPVLKFEDWNLMHHKNIPHLATVTLMHQNISVLSKWSRGVEK